ncbi:hypothetical protein BBAD15_g12423 [Beauveria bassiana D1-5]|uniref:Uncharacterized protein n=1 Tax=Beauveria bassiana D1-5 TaxID=1245745 RepID=A0A0A2V4F7_BEABA|nr:hypothetical protein BBAD15_g12423 [Beauveria bassiana D1-5]
MLLLTNPTTNSQQLGDIENIWPSFTDTTKRNLFRRIYRLDPQLFESIAQESADELRCQQSSTIHGPSNQYLARQPESQDASFALTERRLAGLPPCRSEAHTDVACASPAHAQEESQTSSTTSPTAQFSTTAPPAAQSPGKATRRASRSPQGYFPSLPAAVWKELEEQSPEVYLMRDNETLHSDIIQALYKNEDDMWKVLIRRRFQSIGIYYAVFNLLHSTKSQYPGQIMPQIAERTTLRLDTLRKYEHAGERYQKLSDDLSLGAMVLLSPYCTSFWEQRLSLVASTRVKSISNLREQLAEIDSNVLKRAEGVALRFAQCSKKVWAERFSGLDIVPNKLQRKRKRNGNGDTSNNPTHSRHLKIATLNGLSCPATALSTVYGSPPVQPIAPNPIQLDNQFSHPMMPATALSTVYGSPPVQPIASNLMPFQLNSQVTHPILPMNQPYPATPDQIPWAINSDSSLPITCHGYSSSSEHNEVSATLQSGIGVPVAYGY